MHQPVIVDAVRTPIGRRNGALAHVHPVDLSAHVLDSSDRAQRAGARGDRGRHLGLRQPDRRPVRERRPMGGAGGRVGPRRFRARRSTEPAGRASRRSSSPLPASPPGITTSSSPAVSNR